MVEPVEALEFSRYLVSYIPRTRSCSGFQFGDGLAHHRGREARARARRLDLRRDGQRDDAACETAETLVKVNATPNIKERPDGTRVVTPGTVTYTASMLGLFVAAIALGERVGTLDRARASALVATTPPARRSHGRGRATARPIAARSPRGSRRPQDGHPRRRPELRHRLFRHGQVASRR